MTFKSAFWRFFNYMLFRMNGVYIGKNPDIKYKIYLRKARNGKLTIGDNFTLYSDGNLNPLGRNLRSSICISENAEVSIGHNVGIFASSIRARKSITIGNNVTIGADCILLDSDGHSLDYRKRGTKEDIPVSLPIVIEENVLIGARTTILKGVTIGARTIIGSGSIVTKSIPVDCIAAGNPCKVIRHIDNWDIFSQR